jgi:His/Glu/Gln/Arg/opine family amino acid ABC transporter permease subunit
MNQMTDLAANSGHWAEVMRALPMMLAGLKYTLMISVVSMVIALVLGFFVTALRLSKYAVARAFAFVYVQLFRAFSTYVYILFIYFGLSAFLRIDMPPVQAAILALSLLNSAYIAEIYRSAVVNIDPGLREAAICTGLNRRQAFIHAVLPQAAYQAFPSLLNQFIVILRDSSIVGVIGVADIMFVASKAASVNYLQFEYFTAVAAVFVLIVFVISRLGDVVEKKLAPP